MINKNGRTCSKCGIWKPWSEFHRNRDGPSGYCSHCRNCRSVAHFERKKSEAETRQRLDAKYAECEQLAKQGMKRCSCCKEVRPFDRFCADKRKQDGLQSQCRDCYCDKRRTPKYKERLWLRERGLKRCAHCRKVKPFSEFHRHPDAADKRHSHCKACCRGRKSPNAIIRERLRKQGLKRCIECQQIKELEAFNRFGRSADGHTSYCRDCSKKLCRQWAQENPIKVRIQARTRKARKLQADGQFTEDDIHKLYESQDGICTYFGVDPECAGDLSQGFHIDHIIPLVRTELEPSNNPDNLQLLCPHCNMAKWSRTHEEFLAWLQDAA